MRQRVSELEAIFSTLADALLIVDAKAGLVRMNKVARELLSLEAVVSRRGQ